jgi:hypothetical protein
MPQQPQPQQHTQPQQPPHYTLILRLPFPRPENQTFETTTSNTISQPHQNNNNMSAHQTQTQTLEKPLQPGSAPKLRSPAAPPPIGSEGTPSMGSSFSDLSGASVAQSALEEALMSDLRADGGGLGSRVSSVGR